MIHDLLLDRPLSMSWMQGLLFFTFVLHFVFVLLTIGTCLIGVAALVSRKHVKIDKAAPLDHTLLRQFFVYKSLAITLGVGPLLLIQMGHSVPFLTAANLLAPLWVSVIVVLLISLALIEYVAESGAGSRRRRHRVVGVLGLGFLLVVPAVFVAVLATAGHPEAWEAIYDRNGRMTPVLSLHWLLRWLHVLGAAAVVTGIVSKLMTPCTDPQRRTLDGWIIGGLGFQLVGGAALYFFLPMPPASLTKMILLAGVTTAVILLLVSSRARSLSARPGPAVVSLLTILLISMLLGRQTIQDGRLGPFEQELARRADQTRSAALRTTGLPYRRTADAATGPAIYLQSCSFCHGTVGNGEGEDAGYLLIPPEDLTRLRVGDRALQSILLNGVDGTAMPRFGYYLRPRLVEVTRFLRSLGLMQVAEPVASAVPVEMPGARSVYAVHCIICHGPNGTGTPLGRTFQPAPPNLHLMSLAPDRAFQIISEGYPNTRMPAFSYLPEPVRWGLVEVIRGFYNPTP